VTWGAIGARTTESQVHRQLASGLSMPVGFKNGTDGDVQVAVDACRASATGHTFFGVTRNGVAAVVTTAGNPDTHVILRGGRAGPNYGSSEVTKALDLIAGAGLPRRLMVDASHGNSGKDHRRQPVVAASIADQVAAGEPGLVGVMLESFLREGRQEPGPPTALAYGQSVTDACMDIGTTAAVLDGLAAAVRSRRKALLPNGPWRSWPAGRESRVGVPLPVGSGSGQGTLGRWVRASSIRSWDSSKSRISPDRYVS
jgi:3-deoxy-7-phosphoheptulonate synthase